MDLFKDREDFRDAVEEIMQKWLVEEDYCPHCNEHSRMIKVYECSDRHWRCLGCLGLVYKVSIPIEKIVREYGLNLTSKDLRNYADTIEAEEKKQAEENERSPQPRRRRVF